MAGCSPIRLFNAVIPADGFIRTADLSYGELPRQRLDVYVPKGADAKPRPVVVFFYGGSWDSGSKESYLFVAEALTSKGFVTIVPDYRIYPEVRFPVFIEDAAQAFRWVKQNAAKFGGDPSRVFVMGHSAGAQIAAMLTFNNAYLEQVGLNKSGIKGFIGLSGPYDFLPLTSDRLKVIFGPEEGHALSQPINFVSGNEAPAFLVHGDKDTTVKPGNTVRLAQRIRDRGGTVSELHFPRLDHTDRIIDISAPFRNGKPLLERIEEFIAAQP